MLKDRRNTAFVHGWRDIFSFWFPSWLVEIGFISLIGWILANSGADILHLFHLPLWGMVLIIGLIAIVVDPFIWNKMDLGKIDQLNYLYSIAINGSIGLMFYGSYWFWSYLYSFTI